MEVGTDKSSERGREERAQTRLDQILFRTVDPLPLGAFRIAFGLVLLFRFVTLCLEFDPLFTPRSLVSLDAARSFAQSAAGEPVVYYRWELFSLSNTIVWSRVLFVAYGTSIVAFLLGWRPRLAAILVFLLTVSIHRREPLIWTGGDLVIQCFAFWILFMPIGASLSVDSWKRASYPAISKTARDWMLLLLQGQLALIYFSTFLLKLGTATWVLGTAMSDVWQLPFYARPWSPSLIAIPGMVAAATWGTMVFEIVFPLGIWNARLRPWLLAAGVIFHIGIEATLRTGTFTWAILACYLPAVSAATLRKWIETFNTAAGVVWKLSRRRFASHEV